MKRKARTLLEKTFIQVDSQSSKMNDKKRFVSWDLDQGLSYLKSKWRPVSYHYYTNLITTVQ